MTILLETAAHDPGVGPLIAGLLAFGVLIAGLVAVKLFGAARPHA